MKRIWEAKNVEEATNGIVCGTWEGAKISIDSRLIEEGDIFLALAGEKSNGHDFIESAIKAGAAAIILEYIPNNITYEFNYCKVKDSRKALDDLAIYNRKRLKSKIIAVTGSVGKTSTKEILKVGLKFFGDVSANYGNYNNDLGVSISLASTDPDSKFAIYEVGMNHSGEIIPLVKMIQPDVVVITNVEAAHLEFFDSVKDIAIAKAEIFSGLKPNGLAILNKDNEWYQFLEDIAHNLNIRNITSFGKNDKSDVKIKEYIVEIDNTSKIKLEYDDKAIEYRLSFNAVHIAMASLILVATLRFFDLDVNKSVNNLINFTPIKGRAETSKLNFNNTKITLINDSYNASPASMKAALSLLGSYKLFRKIAVISDMRELGEKSQYFHEDLINEIMDYNIDKIITIGKYMKFLYSILPENVRLFHYQNSVDAISEIKNYVNENDIILIKGSNGTEIYKLAEYIIDNSTKQ